MTCYIHQAEAAATKRAEPHVSTPTLSPQHILINIKENKRLPLSLFRTRRTAYKSHVPNAPTGNIRGYTGSQEQTAGQLPQYTQRYHHRRHHICTYLWRITKKLIVSQNEIKISRLKELAGAYATAHTEKADIMALHYAGKFTPNIHSHMP